MIFGLGLCIYNSKGKNLDKDDCHIIDPLIMVWLSVLALKLKLLKINYPKYEHSFIIYSPK